MQVIDSSAIVKYFAEEKGWESLGQSITEGYTISFALLELGNALLNKLRHGEISKEIAERILEVFSSDAIFLDQNKYLNMAFDIAHKSKLALYDSLFIAVAIGEGCDLLTCDDKQAKVAQQLGVKVIKG